MKTALILFCRAPIPGRCKSRLAADIGPERAAHLYGLMLQHTWNVVQQLRGTPMVYVAEADDAKDVSALFGRSVAVQHGTTLGARMYAAITEARKTHDAVVILGSDVPDLQTAHISAAQQHLETSDVVLGPSRDGGYWLLGLRRDIPELFENMPWSTSDVLHETTRRCDNLGLSYTLVDTLVDVDTVADLLLTSFAGHYAQ